MQPIVNIPKSPESISFVWVSRGTNEPSPDWDKRPDENKFDFSTPKHLWRKSIPWNEKYHGIQNVIDIAQRNLNMQIYVYTDLPDGHELDFILTKARPLPPNMRFIPVEELFKQIAERLGSSRLGKKLMKDLVTIYRSELKYGGTAYAANVVKMMAMYQNGHFVMDFGMDCNDKVLDLMRSRVEGDGALVCGLGTSILHCPKEERYRLRNALQSLAVSYTGRLNQKLREALTTREPREKAAEELLKRKHDIPPFEKGSKASYVEMAKLFEPEILKGWKKVEEEVSRLTEKETIKDNIKAAQICMKYLLSDWPLQDGAYAHALHTIRGEWVDKLESNLPVEELPRNHHKSSHLKGLMQVSKGIKKFDIAKQMTRMELMMDERTKASVQRMAQSADAVTEEEFQRKWKREITKSAEKNEFLKRAKANSHHCDWLGKRVVVASKITKDDSQMRDMHQETLDDWKKHLNKRRIVDLSRGIAL